jgi:hypothetical protein
MSWRDAAATCRTAARIGETLLDGGTPSAADRLHVAGCAACTREAERASRFLARLALAAESAIDDVLPVAAGVGASRWLRRVLATATMLAGAAAAGLLLAAIVGLRLTPPVGEAPTLGSVATAERRLERLDLTCTPVGGGAVCASRAADHAHRVTLTADDGAVVGMEAGIIGTQARAIDLRGADDLLRRMTTAALEGSHEAAATAWLAANYARCASTCSADVNGMHLELERRDDAVILSVEAR